MTTAPRSSSQPAGNGRLSNIISKITSPFSPKARTFADFYITTAEDPRPSYAPGDSVKGWVNLVITKPTRVTHITVVFHGFAKVYRHAAAPGEGNPVEAALLKGSATMGNGSVVIFENESVVCGDGRLSPGRYRFGFDFKFPQTSIPSSINFERGTISYVVSAALTRPTTIAPTVLCDKKVELIETIDISQEPMCRPKQRAISMRPIMKKKTKTNKSMHSEANNTPSLAPSQATRPSSSQADQHEPQSPSVSEFSTHSGLTSSNDSAPMQIVNVETLDGSQGRNSVNTVTDDEKIITAQVHLLRSGYLPGDTIPIKISIKHTKHIQSMRGVIVTLYRKARVNPRSDRGLHKIKSKGDYVPKSRTAFGGLSFAPARPDHTFRMDLNQNFAPLITNPNTLRAEIKTFVTVPDDAFPSITCVPEQMIHFTYHLEVIMDINNKLAHLDRFLPRISITNNPSNPTLGQAAGQGHPHGNLNQFFDTTDLRRNESIPDCCFDIIIGTKDGARKPTKRPFDPWDLAQAAQTPQQEDRPELDNNVLVPHTPPPPLLDHETPRPPSAIPARTIPPPAPEEEVDEKTRLRRAEERLLPSEPPADDASSSTMLAPQVPSAPVLHDTDHDIYRREHNVPSYHAASAPSFDAVNGTAPVLDDFAGPSNPGPSAPEASSSRPGDDKQELERQRLLAAASAPDYRNENDIPEAFLATTTAPTAPILHEETTEYSQTNTTRSRDEHAVQPMPGGRAAEGARGAHDAFGSHEDEHELPTYQR